MIAGYLSGHRGMAGSVAYSLTQWMACMSTRRAAVCQVTRWLARQGMCRVMDCNRRIVVLKEVHEILGRDRKPLHTFEVISIFYLRSSNLTVGESFFKNSFGGRSQCSCATTRSFLIIRQASSYSSIARPPQMYMLDFHIHHSSHHPHRNIIQVNT